MNHNCNKQRFSDDKRCARYCGVVQRHGAADATDATATVEKIAHRSMRRRH